MQSPRLLRQAFEHYQLIGNGDGMTAVRKALEELGEDISGLPTTAGKPPLQMPWRWIRLATELAILAAAAYLLFRAR